MYLRFRRIFSLTRPEAATADLQRTRKTINEFRSHVNKIVNNLDEGALGFSVFRFWLFFRMVFRLLWKKRRFFDFGARVHCGLRIFCFFELLVGFWIWYPMWILVFPFGFWLLFDLSAFTDLEWSRKAKVEPISFLRAIAC